MSLLSGLYSCFIFDSSAHYYALACSSQAIPGDSMYWGQQWLAAVAVVPTEHDSASTNNYISNLWLSLLVCTLALHWQGPYRLDYNPLSKIRPIYICWTSIEFTFSSTSHVFWSPHMKSQKSPPYHMSKRIDQFTGFSTCAINMQCPTQLCMLKYMQCN